MGKNGSDAGRHHYQQMPSLLEQIVKGATRVGRPLTRAATAARIPSTRVAGFPLDGSPGHEEIASIASVFLGDALRDCLRTFETNAGIKVTTILTRTKVSTAFGTLTVEIDFYLRRNHRPAKRTTQYFLETGHLHRTGAFAPRRAFGPLLLRRLRFGSFAIAATILVAALPVFPVGHGSPRDYLEKLRFRERSYKA
jgi:hypothetical protein